MRHGAHLAIRVMGLMVIVDPFILIRMLYEVQHTMDVIYIHTKKYNTQERPFYGHDITHVKNLPKLSTHSSVGTIETMNEHTYEFMI